jgi:hypothetical protein
MRILAIIVNVALLILVGFLAANHMGDFNEEDILILAMFIGTPTVTLLYFFLSKPHTKGWFVLYLQRKALEEKKKIDDLKRTDHT